MLRVYFKRKKNVCNVINIAIYITYFGWQKSGKERGVNIRDLNAKMV